VSSFSPYFEHHIPAHADDPAFTSLRGLSDLVAIEIRTGGQAETYHLWFEAGRLAQGEPPAGKEPRARFAMSREAFESIVGGELAPQMAFFTGRLRIHGDMLFGLQLGTLLAGLFRRHPWRSTEVACG
jgi:putative sterol carrier protein